MRDDEHWTAVGRYLAGESPAEEQAYVRRWLAEDPGNQKLLDALNSGAASLATPPKNLDVEAALARVHERIDQPDVRPLRPVGERPEEPQLSLPGWMKIAAVLALIAASWFTTSRRGPRPARTYAAAIGRSDSVVLSDGTGVLLAPGSVLNVRPGFGRTTRLVEVVGEAMFDVEPGDVSFNVEFPDGVVHDISTRFSVRSDPGSPVRVLVLEGAVWLDVNGAHDTLRAGERAVISNGRIERDSARAADLAWALGELAFDNAPLSQVRSDLLRWYGIELVVADSALARSHLTATFRGEPAEQVLGAIALALGARVERRGDSVFVHPR